VSRTRPTSVPSSGQLWLSRPPFCLIARVLSVDLIGGRIEYELVDRGGAPLCEPVSMELDESWWRFFKPLTRRMG
jgi:hypothetical protein